MSTRADLGTLEAGGLIEIAALQARRWICDFAPA